MHHGRHAKAALELYGFMNTKRKELYRMGMHKDQNGFGLAGILSMIAVIVVIIAVGWLFWKNFIAKESSADSASSQAATDSIAIPSSPAPYTSTPPSTNSIVVQ